MAEAKKEVKDIVKPKAKAKGIAARPPGRVKTPSVLSNSLGAGLLEVGILIRRFL